MRIQTVIITLTLLMVSVNALMVSWEYGSTLHVEGYGCPTNTTLTLKAYVGGSEQSSKSVTTGLSGEFSTSFSMSSWPSGEVRACYGTASDDVCSNLITHEAEVTQEEFDNLTSTVNAVKNDFDDLSTSYSNFTEDYDLDAVNSRVTVVENKVLNLADDYSLLNNEIQANYSSFQSSLESRVAEVESSASSVSERMSSLETTIAESVDAKVSSVDTRIDGLENETATELDAVTANLELVSSRAEQANSSAGFNLLLGIVITLFVVVVLAVFFWFYAVPLQVRQETKKRLTILADKAEDVIEDRVENLKKSPRSRCTIVTRDGTRCERDAMRNSNKCFFHQRAKEQEDDYYQG